MKKQEQQEINEKVKNHFRIAMSQLPRIAFSYLNREQLKACRKEGMVERLRSCEAWVWEVQDYYVLQSYQTFIAVIEKSSDTCYDALREVYGYTSTSAQHIAKFRKDYGSGKWGCEHELTYREVGE